MSEVLTLKEAAKLLRVHPMTLYQVCRLGKIPCAKLKGQWRFRRVVLEKWLEGAWRGPR